MSTTGSFIVYICLWWIVFFSILPVGIRSENLKFTEKLQGNDPGAPKNPEIMKKFILTTIFFICIYYIVSNNHLNLREYLQ